MNYYFFLDFSNIGLSSHIEIFNSPSIAALYSHPLTDKNIIIFCSDNNKWKYLNYGLLKKNSSITINVNDLPSDFRNKSTFLYLSEDKTNFDINYKSNYSKTTPEWRSNIKISSDHTSCSYQGELPSIMKNKKISLLSCSPMTQYNSHHENYFILANLTNDPKIKKFDVEILDNKKNLIDKTTFFTNSINKYNLNRLGSKTSNKMLVFKSTEEGGIPLYFARDKENKSMSLEHTHPPQAYFIFGDTIKFQKHKKKFWF